jgi:hypothetical protein
MFRGCRFLARAAPFKIGSIAKEKLIGYPEKPEEQ